MIEEFLQKNLRRVLERCRHDVDELEDRLAKGHAVEDELALSRKLLAEVLRRLRDMNGCGFTEYEEDITCWMDDHLGES